MPKYFVQFSDQHERDELAVSSLLAPDRLQRGGSLPYLSRTEPTVLIADLDEADREALQVGGAVIFEDLEFDLFGASDAKIWNEQRYWEASPSVDQPEQGGVVGLPEVLNQIRAPEAWVRSRGEGVTIAVIDTGVCGSLSEFPADKRSPVDPRSAFAGRHWSDTKGHGSMCATIAAASRAAGGRFDGVAPDALVLSARTTLFSTDVYTIYDELRAAKANGQIEGPLVVSNSYGSYTCSPLVSLPENHPYLQIVLDTIADGITVVFAAGNNHHDVLCNHDPLQCQPSTIWGVNSHEQVLSVGTVDRNGSNQDPGTPHVNSSRGPGQWSRNLPKPDCVAPTYGEVVWGCGYRQMPWWGTSGACPQVAGLAALLLGIDPALMPRDVGDVIRRTCRPLAAADTCVGAGLIDCAAAVQAI